MHSKNYFYELMVKPPPYVYMYIDIRLCVYIYICLYNVVCAQRKIENIYYAVNKDFIDREWVRDVSKKEQERTRTRLAVQGRSID